LDVSNSVWEDMFGNSKGDGPGFAQELAIGVKDNGALSVLSLKKNNLCNQEAGKALSEMLAVNTVLKELDVSENTYYKCDSAGFTQELAVGISDTGALTKFDISKCDLRVAGGEALAAGLKGNQVITELNISNNALGKNSGNNVDTSGIIAIADAIPDMGALIKLDVRGNAIGADQEQEGGLQRICLASGIELAK
jgi:hypothetical protein